LVHGPPQREKAAVSDRKGCEGRPVKQGESLAAPAYPLAPRPELDCPASGCAPQLPCFWRWRRGVTSGASHQGAFNGRLEPYDGKLSCTVLRRQRERKLPNLSGVENESK
jgi:hypothetical protein